MGAFLEKPNTEKYNEHGSGNGLRYGLASMQGWRVEMEDAHCAVTELPGQFKDWSFFAVFDGHAGARVSDHCAAHLLECIMETEEFRKSFNDEEQLDENLVKKGIHSGFLFLDHKMREIPEMASGEDKSGSTAVCALISPKYIYIANCGDSRAVLCRGSHPTFSTLDHKPMIPSEKDRIQKAGGSVMIQRVNGALAVSRALGDYEYKNVEGKGPCEQLVSPEPEIFVEKRDLEKDEFLILACDGVWDVMSNKDLCDFIRSRLLLTDDLESITSQVIDTCLYIGSQDNMSIVLVTFPGAPQPSAEAISLEKQLDDALEMRVKEALESNPRMKANKIFARVTNDDIPGLPPGGGFLAKRNFILSVIDKLCPKLDKESENSQESENLQESDNLQESENSQESDNFQESENLQESETS